MTTTTTHQGYLPEGWDKPKSPFYVPPAVASHYQRDLAREMTLRLSPPRVARDRGTPAGFDGLSPLDADALRARPELDQTRFTSERAWLEAVSKARHEKPVTDAERDLYLHRRAILVAENKIRREARQAERQQQWVQEHTCTLCEGVDRMVHAAWLLPDGTWQAGGSESAHKLMVCPDCRRVVDAKVTARLADVAVGSTTRGRRIDDALRQFMAR